MAGTQLLARDNLEILRAENAISKTENRGPEKSRCAVQDAFNLPAEPGPARQSNATVLTKLWAWIRKFPRVLRYFVYGIPLAAALAVPILLGWIGGDTTAVGGNYGPSLFWFGVWLELVLGPGFLVAKILVVGLPLILQGVAHLVGSNNSTKWKDIGRHLELHTATFIWAVAVYASYDSILNNPSHRAGCPAYQEGDPCYAGALPSLDWITVCRKVALTGMVLAALNFFEKILIQWIATAFHSRTYVSRIETLKNQTDYLVHMYAYAKEKEPHIDPFTAADNDGLASGARTPMRTIQNNARHAWSRVGQAANRVAGDLTGRKILKGNHPRKIVNELLRTSSSSQVLARFIYRAFASTEREFINLDDFRLAFNSQEEADACFSVFDKDLNGDLTMEELELVCNEIQLEKKAIAASVKDLDSVMKKLDHVFLMVIVVVCIVVFVSIISTSAAASLTTFGTILLGLSWLLAATAQEFLQSIIFVFIKHPFDVGDRVTVYGSTGPNMKGDDYYVLEVSLLYTEFKKMEGHVVQSPNSYLNTLFIMNHRRSGPLADPIELKLKFGTSSEAIAELAERMTKFCLNNRRDYSPKVLTEIRSIEDVRSITMNIIFFHKSSFQNELVRLQRHNNFAAELQRQMVDLKIQGPWLMAIGASDDYPNYIMAAGQGGGGPETPRPPGCPAPPYTQPSAVPVEEDRTPRPSASPPPSQSTYTSSRNRSESRVVSDFPDFQDVFEGRMPDHRIARGGVAEARRAENPLPLLNLVRSRSGEPGPDARVTSHYLQEEARNSGDLPRRRTGGFLHSSRDENGAGSQGDIV